MVATPTNADELAYADGHLAAAHDSIPSTLVLIRPDGSVGAISDAGDADVIERSLRAF